MSSKWLKGKMDTTVPKSVDEIVEEAQLAEATLQQTASVDLQQESEIEDVPNPSKPETEGKQEKIPHYKLSPAALRLYPIYEKIDSKGYITPKDFNRICLLVGGDTRRVFQRVLLGIYQRAHIKKNGEDVKKARTLLSLHESGSLLPNIDHLNEEMFL